MIKILHQRKQLEADVVGLKAWVRTMQLAPLLLSLHLFKQIPFSGTERAYRELLTELAQCQDRLELADKTNTELRERMDMQNNQLEASRHQVTVLASQLQQSAKVALDEKRGGAAADHAVKMAAAAQIIDLTTYTLSVVTAFLTHGAFSVSPAQVASAEEGRGLAERRAADAEDRNKAVTARYAFPDGLVHVHVEVLASTWKCSDAKDRNRGTGKRSQAIERMVAKMEGRIGSLGAQVASLGHTTGSSTAGSTLEEHNSGGSKEQGTLLAACHALANSAEAMADAMVLSLSSVDAHCGAPQQIEVGLKMQALDGHG
eukprot:scaffold33187_cov18-Tisochrysis_lutea.AAC.2